MESSIAVFLKRWEACELPPTNWALSAGALRGLSLPPCAARTLGATTSPGPLYFKKNFCRSWPRRPAESSFESCQRYESCLGAHCNRCTAAHFRLATPKTIADVWRFTLERHTRH